MKKLILSCILMLFLCNMQGQTSNHFCSQAWMDYNLNTGTYRNGDKIPYIADPKEWAALTTGAWCWYYNDSSRYQRFGKLYNWYAIKDPRGLAPEGWHIPTDAEWVTLTTCKDGIYAGTAGLGTGYRDITGDFRRVNGYTFWWSTSETDTGLPVIYGMNIAQNRTKSTTDKRNGLSVLCIKD